MRRKLRSVLASSWLLAALGSGALAQAAPEPDGGSPDGGSEVERAGNALAADPMPPLAERVSLQQAVTRALARNPTAFTAAAELRRAAALVEQARAAAFPTASFNLADTYLDGARVFQGFVVTPQNTFLANLALTLPLLAPPQWGRWAHALNDEAVAKWTAKDTERQLSLAVAHAYLAVIVQQRVLDLDLRARENDQRHYDYTHQRLQGGLGTPLDELRAKQQFESDAAAAESAALEVERAEEALGVLLGEDHPVGIVEEPSFEVPNPSDSDRDLLGARALELRPDLRAAKGRKDAALQVSRDDWLDYLPQANAIFEPIYQSPPSAFQPRWSWELLLALTFPIYDGGLRYGQAHERAALLVEADKAFEQSLRQTGSDIRLGFRAVTRGDSALRNALAAAAAAHQAQDVANLQYRTGAVTNIDVIDAERRARDADTIAEEAADAARQARLDLLSGLGRFP